MSDTFQTSNGVPANFATNSVKIKVNGSEYHNSYSVGTKTVGELVNEIARSKGIKTFSVYVAGGRKLDTADASRAANAFSEYDIVAKDSRGTDSTVWSA